MQVEIFKKKLIFLFRKLYLSRFQKPSFSPLKPLIPKKRTNVRKTTKPVLALNSMPAPTTPVKKHPFHFNIVRNMQTHYDIKQATSKKTAEARRAYKRKKENKKPDIPEEVDLDEIQDFDDPDVDEPSTSTACKRKRNPPNRFSPNHH